jgi:hypothetical protein
MHPPDGMDAKQSSGAICRSDDVMKIVGLIGALIEVFE